VVRVIPDVVGLVKEFDYLVPDGHEVPPVGSMVRIQLGPRRVAAWISAVGVGPPEGLDLRPLSKISGLGPPAPVIDLARWVARCWAGPLPAVLGAASPPRMVRSLPAAGHLTSMSAEMAGDGAEIAEVTVRRLRPDSDTADVVAEAVGRAPAIVIAPSIEAAVRLARRLRAGGLDVALLPDEWAAAAAGGRVVVGTRLAALAPCVDERAIVVVDEHDEAHQETRTPTWHARDIAIERGRRRGVPVVVTSPCPSVATLVQGRLVAPPRNEERRGWAQLEVIDLREEDPTEGLLSSPLVRALRRPGPVACVLNRTGRARLLACPSCRQLACCDRCDGAVAQVRARNAGDGGLFDEGGDILRCRRCGEERPVVCHHCGTTRLAQLRPGVARLRRDLEALLGEPVAEISAQGASPAGTTARVSIGTEAVLHRTAEVSTVAFVDFDQELTAHRHRAAEEALVLLARASRLVGGRRGRVVVQTRRPTDTVLRAALHGDPGLVAAEESVRRRLLGYAPFGAVAVISGAGASTYATRLRRHGASVDGPTGDRWLVRATDRDSLVAGLVAVPRPSGRLRIEVDPLRG
jgi:primosomal protein N' (replication factor Y)